MLKIIKTLNYNYNVTIKEKLSPRCKYPRETVYRRLRHNIIYIDHNEEIVKSIIYDPKLLFTQVYEDDIIEHDIIEIKNLYPGWSKIEIKLLK